MKKLIIITLLLAGCATIPRTDTRLIDSTIDDLKTITPATQAERSAINRAVVQLEQSKQVTEENADLKKQIDSDTKYVKAGKLVYGGIILFAIAAVGLFVFKLVR
ncbi:MAG TPA: hypothetical protein PLA54_11780 [Spirochaetota bacterium]|nr:hypothetical protein [Spirochaetota bacterium]